MSVSTSVIERVRKLLAVADDPTASDGEIANATAAAATLMERHNIDRAMLNVGERPKTAADFKYGRRFVALTTKLYRWESSLAYVVCKVVGLCDSYRDNVDGGGRVLVSIVFYGEQEASESASELYSTLRNVIIERATSQYGGCYVGDGGSYAEGFVSGLDAQRLAAQQDDAAPALPDVKAITVVQRDELVALGKSVTAAACKAFGLKLYATGGSSGPSGSREAFETGKSDGERQPVVVKSGARRLTGGVA